MSNPAHGTVEYYRQQFLSSQKTAEQKAAEQQKIRENYAKFQAANIAAQQEAVRTGTPQVITHNQTPAGSVNYAYAPSGGAGSTFTPEQIKQEKERQATEAEIKVRYEALQNVNKELQSKGGGIVTPEMLEAERNKLIQTKYAEGIEVSNKLAQAEHLRQVQNLLSQGYTPSVVNNSLVFTKTEQVQTRQQGTADSAYLTPKPGMPGTYEGFTQEGGYERVIVSAPKNLPNPAQQFNPDIAQQVWRSTVGLTGNMIAGVADLLGMAVGKGAPVNKQISSGLESFAEATRQATGLEGLAKVYETLAGISGQKAYAYAALQAKTQAQAEKPVINPLSAAAGGIAALAGIKEGKEIVDAFIEQTQKRPLETAITSLFDFYMAGGSRLTRANIESGMAKIRSAEQNIATKIMKAEPIKKAYAEELKPVSSPPPASPPSAAASPGGFKNVTIDLGTGYGEVRTIPTVPIDTVSTSKPDKTSTTSTKPEEPKTFKESGSGEGQTLLTIQKSEVKPLTTEQLAALQKELDEIKLWEQKELEAAKLRELLRKAEQNESKVANNILSTTTSQALGLYGQTGIERLTTKKKSRIEELHNQQQYRLPDELAEKQNIKFAEKLRSQSSIILPQVDTDKALNEMTKIDNTKRQAQMPQAATDILPSRVSATNQAQVRFVDHAQQVKEEFKQIEQAMSKMLHSQKHDQSFKFKFTESTRTKQDYREIQKRDQTSIPLPSKVTGFYFGSKKGKKKNIDYGERLWRLNKVEDILFTGEYSEEPFF